MKDQTNGLFNGVYVATNGKWVRASDFEHGTFVKGSVIHVLQGTEHGGKTFMCDGDRVDVNVLTFELFGGGSGGGAAAPLQSVQYNENSALKGSEHMLFSDEYNEDFFDVEVRGTIQLGQTLPGFSAEDPFGAGMIKGVDGPPENNAGSIIIKGGNATGTVGEVEPYSGSVQIYSGEADIGYSGHIELSTGSATGWEGEGTYGGMSGDVRINTGYGSVESGSVYIKTRDDCYYCGNISLAPGCYGDEEDACFYAGDIKLEVGEGIAKDGSIYLQNMTGGAIEIKQWSGLGYLDATFRQGGLYFRKEVLPVELSGGLTLSTVLNAGGMSRWQGVLQIGTTNAIPSGQTAEITVTNMEGIDDTHNIQITLRHGGETDLISYVANVVVNTSFTFCIKNVGGVSNSAPIFVYVNIF